MTEKARPTPAQRKALEAMATEVLRYDPPYGIWRLGTRTVNRRMCEAMVRNGWIDPRAKSLGSSVYQAALTDLGRSVLVA